MPYDFTTQAQVRKAFWAENPGVSRKRIPNFSGNGKMFTADTRTAFCNWLDCLSKDGRISSELAQRVTLGDGK